MEIVPQSAARANRIRQLPDTVANQIAAGEVVERPSSVIKELVENSLDAGASLIFVSYRNGGKSLIEVTDNGCGMSGDDALLAFERHATSKISDAEDLRSVLTLGFRGEALPSIASVSRLILSTCLPGAAAGTEVVTEGGKLREVRDCAPIPGTRISVRDIFFNVPVRRKFLRAEEVEGRHSHEAILRLALSRPHVAFKIVRDGRPAVDAPALHEDDVKGRIGDLFGRQAIDELTHVEFENGGIRVYGYVSRPGLSKPSRDTQYIYVNGRFVRDRLINFAVSEAYRSLMPRGRFPALFLFIDLPAGRVDVNAHPAKTEVRFVDGNSVINIVKAAISGSFHKKSPSPIREIVPAPSFTRDDTPAPPEIQPPFRRPSFAETPAPFDDEKSACVPVQPTRNMTAPETTAGETDIRPLEGFAPFNGTAPDDFRVIGQVFGSFLLVEEAGRLLMFDQHTVHERVLYERFMTRYKNSRIEGQDLLFPVEISLPKNDAETLRERLDDFTRLGYVIEEFGEDSFAVRSAPALLAGKDHRAVIGDVVDRFRRFGAGTDIGRIAEEAINIMACRGAVKAGATLTPREIESLIKSLKDCALPYTCPHGRPVALAVEKEDVLKSFLRK